MLQIRRLLGLCDVTLLHFAFVENRKGWKCRQTFCHRLLWHRSNSSASAWRRVYVHYGRPMPMSFMHT